MIELGQIRRVHDDHRRGRKFVTGHRQSNHVRGGERRVVDQQHPQRVIDGNFAGPGRVLKDRQIVPGAEPLVAVFAEPVIGQTEARRGEEILAIGIVGEGARLADQRIDDVPVMHGRAIPAHQSRQRVHVLIGVPDLDAVGEEPGLHLVADQAAVHRIGVAMDVNQAAGVDAAPHLQTGGQSLIRQVAQGPDLFGETVAATRIPQRHDALQEACIVIAAGKVAAAPQQQRLIDGGLEMTVRRLRITILVRLPRVRPLARHAIVR